MVATSTAAETRPASCVCPPTDAFTAVRGVGRGHREGREEAGRDVGRSEADELAVGVHRIAAAGAGAARRDDPAAKLTKAPPRPLSSSELSGSEGAGNARRGQAARHLADDGDAAALEVEQPGEQHRQRHDDHRARDRQTERSARLQIANIASASASDGQWISAGPADELDDGGATRPSASIFMPVNRPS